jgi:alkylation response protein AidB-like acyl-CoA dehydrogenase
MDFSLPPPYLEELERFQSFLDLRVNPEIFNWYREGAVPRSFFHAMAEAGWYNFRADNGRLDKLSALRWALFMERLASISPGLAVMVLAHVDLGTTALWLFGSDDLKEEYGIRAVRGETLLCLGSTESHAGSDAAGISTRAEKVDGGWLLSGTKAYVTGGMTGDYAVITAVTDAQAPRSSRLSMFLVDLGASGVRRMKLGKQVWIPADLAQMQLKNVFVPDGHLMGSQGHGLQQVLTVFTYSRVPISALTIGTAAGAFNKGLEHARKRELFGNKLIEFQAKQFEAADMYAQMESARLSLWKACWTMDSGQDFQMESSIAKYLCVKVAREVTIWAADLFGAESVMFEHPIHKYPMDAWAASLGEGTQDVQKLVIFRELLKRFG